MNAMRLLALFAALWLTGCVGIVPVPTPAHGAKLSQSRVDFIKPGQTSRAEVLSHLGTNCVTIPARPALACPAALAYSWEGGVEWFSWLVVPVPGVVGYQETASRGSWHAFFVAFDPNDVVIAKAFKTLKSDVPLHEQLFQWATHLPPKP